MANAVLVIDMLKGFLAPGAALYCGDAAQEIVPRVRERIQRELDAGAYLVFVQDTHEPDDLEFEVFPRHCVVGTEEVDVIDELADLAREAVRLPKRRYSALFDTDLDRRLAQLHPERVVVMGVCTDICVLHTVADLRNRDYAVEVPSACVASFDEQQHRWALVHMEKILGATITT